MTKLIVSGSSDDVTVYAATEANALEILSWYISDIDSEVIKLMNHLSNGDTVLMQETILKQLHGILSEDQSKLPAAMSVTKENKQELINYLFEHKISISDGKINAHQFFKNFKISDLSFLHKNYGDCILTQRYLLDDALKYKVILNKEWKANASEIAKINYILDFVNGLTDRNNKYYVTELKENA